MNRTDPMRMITIRELWRILIQRLWVILLAAVIAAASVFAVLQITYKPLYSSTATLYILRQSESGALGDASDDFSLALKVVNDCTYLLKSHTVLNAVIEEMDLDMRYEDLEKAVSTMNPENTRILEVTVEASSPELAKQVVDRICELGQESIAQAMGFEQVNLFERGALNDKPSNTHSAAVYILVGFAAAVLVYLVFLAIYFLDDSMKTNEDIEKYLGISVLGEIPDMREAAKSHYSNPYSNPKYGRFQGK